MATFSVVLHADKFILIYLQPTKVPYPKHDLNYGYSILHLLEQIDSILCQKQVLMIKYKMGCSTCNLSSSLAKDAPATELSVGSRTHTARINNLAAGEESTWAPGESSEAGKGVGLSSSHKASFAACPAFF